jgi:hypothetical protein
MSSFSLSSEVIAKVEKNIRVRTKDFPSISDSFDERRFPIRDFGNDMGGGLRE